MRKVLFIDRDGTLIKEAPPSYQLDSFSKLEFYPEVFFWMRKIAEELDYELVMITNQDGMGTSTFPENTFWPVHDFIITALKNENIVFNEVLIDRTFPSENALTRKPGTGLLTKYINNANYDLAASFVIGDRITDVELAKNLGCKAIWINVDTELGKSEIYSKMEELESVVTLATSHWKEIYEILALQIRVITHERKTKETIINIQLSISTDPVSSIDTGLNFFNHMLEQLSKHSGIGMILKASGDLHIDEHHTIEDVGIVLGEAINKLLGDKTGMERYGFMLPMDDALATASIDFGGRSWLIWEVEFSREKIGDMPTEMFHHFFKSFTDAAKCNLYIHAEGQNEHHKIEAIFKAVAKAIRMAIKREPGNFTIPSTKGML